MVATESLLDGNQLSLTQLGRNIQGKVKAKHSIKRIDRLLGNPHLRTDRLDIYRWHAMHLYGANPMPIVDVREFIEREFIEREFIEREFIEPPNIKIKPLTTYQC